MAIFLILLFFSKHQVMV
uniref:Uncharacterized protein n=1 Tax=Rhodnius prolixus TaxID=13249 RepID=T1HSP0_RHOPR